MDLGTSLFDDEQVTFGTHNVGDSDSLSAVQSLAEVAKSLRTAA